MDKKDMLPFRTKQSVGALIKKTEFLMTHASPSVRPIQPLLKAAHTYLVCAFNLFQTFNPRIHSAYKAEMVAFFYKEGMPRSEIERRLLVSSTYVSKILKTKDIPFRYRREGYLLRKKLHPRPPKDL